MPFTCVTLYNPDSQDNNLCDKRILAITNLEIKQINRKKMFCAIQQTSDGLLFLHRSYMRANQNGGLLLRENQARQLSTRLNKPLTAQRRSHRLIEPSNHWTKNLKSLKNMVCCRLMPGSNNSQTAVYGEAEYCNATIIVKQLSMATILLCFEFFRCRVDVLQSQCSRGTIGIAVFYLQNLKCLLVIFADQVFISYVLRHIRLGSVAVLCG